MNYIPLPVSKVRPKHVLYWQSVNADVEVISMGSGSFGYTFTVEHRGELEHARYRHGDTVQVRGCVVCGSAAHKGCECPECRGEFCSTCFVEHLHSNIF